MRQVEQEMKPEKMNVLEEGGVEETTEELAVEEGIGKKREHAPK